MTAAADRALVRARMAAQEISTTSEWSPAAIVRWMTAMQAQDVASATWSIGLRNPKLSLADINRAFVDGSIVRSWPMRGTLHLVAPEDLRWILALTRERLIRGSLARRLALGLGEADLERARTAAHAALSGGRSRPRNAMYRVFDDAGVATTGQRGYHILWFLSQTGTLIFGPPSGTTQTFALLDEWAPVQRQLERDEAIGEFVLRYFRSHGPASIRDFAWWSSMTLTEARTGLALARHQLDSVDRDGEPLYFAADTALDFPRDGVRLLPGFDEYLLGYRDRTPQLPASRADDIVPGGNGVFRGTVVDDGTVVGSWKRTPSRTGVALDIRMFSSANSRIDRGISQAERSYSEFVSGAHGRGR